MILSSNVFVGTVTSISNNMDNSWQVHFNVENFWKGTPGQRLTVITNDLEGCGYSITSGEKYLVYTSGSPPFLQKSWTKPYSNAQADMTLLNDSNFQAQEKSKEELNKKLENAKNTIESMMESKMSTIPFNSVGVDEINSTLDIGIDSARATLSEDQYQEKIKEIVGDIPISIGFSQINTANDTSGNSVQNLAHKLMLSPLQQLKSGIAANNVTCKQDFELIFKTKDGSPACVKPDTANILVERGWAKLVYNQK